MGNLKRPSRVAILAVAIVAAILSMLVFGVFWGMVVLAFGVAAAAIGGARPGVGPTGWGTGWRPTVEHRELPPPPNDPVVSYGEPQLEMFALGTPPLAELGLPIALRGQLDGFALGRAKRIMEAPNLMAHAAADGESWPQIEQAVARALALAASQHVEVGGEGQSRLIQALAFCATQGVLLAEWRQMDDGVTIWDGPAARVRASDTYAIYRMAETLKRRMLPDLFAGVIRRGSGFELSLLVPYTIALGFYLRLHGTPPRVAAA